MLSIRGTALITGAASGIGKACALGYAKAGARALAICDISSSGLKATTEELKTAATSEGFEVFAETVDVRDESAIDKFVSGCKSAFGRIDYAANIAGISEDPHPTAKLSTAQFDNVHAINSRGVFMSMRAELQAMLSQEPIEHKAGRSAERGAIINMSSALGLFAMTGYTSYTTAKHAVLGMTKSAAIAHGEHGIRVNAVCPGFIATPMLAHAGKAPEVAEVVNDSAVRNMRLGKAEEVADVVLFLSSAEASFVAGQGWLVDGGRSAVY